MQELVQAQSTVKDFALMNPKNALQGEGGREESTKEIVSE